MDSKQYTREQIMQEAKRLFVYLQKTNRSMGYCIQIAPKTLEINERKKEQDAIILAHSYQTPEIMYGVADFLGDSYGLSKIAAETDAKKIVFCSVYFMGETAKILNPSKEVLVPAIAGCSLADAITAENVRNLKAKYPGVPVVCYVNTSAAVKAESDICCTSANVMRIIDSLDTDQVIFIPDRLMGENIQTKTNKELILWDGTCIVHEQFDRATAKKIRAQYPGVKILAHLECSSSLVAVADLVGSTSDMLHYIKEHAPPHVMLITECGITDRVKTEHPDKHIVGACQLCPFMKQITLDTILASLRNPQPEQIIEIPQDILKKAYKSLHNMMTR